MRPPFASHLCISIGFSISSAAYSGATEAASPCEVVSRCKVTYAMLSDPAASEAVVFGKDGVLEGIPEGHSYIDCSTIDEHIGCRVAEALQARGARFLAAPVSGGWREAAKGSLLFIAGGDQGLYSEVTSEGGSMAAMGARHWLVGPSPSQSCRAKLMLQIMMGTMIGALAETTAVSEGAGLDPAMILDMFNSSAMGNNICKAKGKLMLEGAYPGTL